MIWSLVQQIGGQVASMLVLLVLAALLSPADFGLIGMAGAWLALLSAFAETGFSAALVQRDSLRSEHLTSTFGINLGVGALLTLVGVGLSWPAALYFRTPALQPVMAVMSLGLLIRSLGLTQLALAQRDLRFRALAARDLAASALGGAVGIAMALTGWGVWSLVVMSLVTALIGTLLLWRLAQWRPRWGEASRSAVAELWPFGSRMLAFSAVKAVAQNTDRLIIGPLLGPHALGLYTVAWKLVIFPVTTFVGALGQYLFPRVSRLQADPAAAGSVYRGVMIAIMNVVLPGLAVAVVLAPTVVPVLGEQWREAIPVVQVLAVVAAAQALIAPVGQLMKGLGRPGWLLAWSIGFTLLCAAALLLGSRGGLVVISGALALAHLAALPVIVAIGRRLTGVGAADLALVTWRPALAAAVLAAVLGTAVQYAVGWSRVAVAVAAVGGALAYWTILTRYNPEFADLVLRQLRQLRRAPDPTT